MCSEISAKERILGAMKGTPIDRVPWSPFLTYYWEHQPQSVRDKGQFAYLKEIGADPLLRGSAQCFTIRHSNCNIRQESNGNISRTYYETPVGTIFEEYTYVPSANTRFLTNHPVEDVDDLKVLQYLHENMDIIEAPENLLRQYNEMGENGVVMPVVGCGMKTSFQYLLEHWCGTENLIYLIYDEPEAVAECLSVMCAKDSETMTYTLNTPAESVLFFEDSSTTNISPALFAKYAAPQISAWAEAVHKEGKLLVHHACGHLKDLLPVMSSTGIDVIESISPPPTGNIELIDARKCLPDHIGLIGGIEPTFFESCKPEDLDPYVENLLSNMKNSRYILANSDSCPPGVTHEKMLKVGALVRKYGNY